MNATARVVLRHWTALLIGVAALGWAVFYLPNTPSFAVVELKRAVDARDGDAAARYLDFEGVVKHAGYEMVEKKPADNPLGQMLGKGAVDLLAKPTAAFLASWIKQRVDEGDQNLRMPTAAIAGAILLMRRHGDSAYTHFRDPKGRDWEIHLARGPDGRWRVDQVKDAGQLLHKLEHEEQKRLGSGRPSG